jgi:DNA sulfur modification protein DndB
MATVVPAIRAKFGDITYYEAVMAARDLVSAVRPASEMDGWATMRIEERMQRDLDLRRIQAELVPYLAKSPDRFWGSIIVLVYRSKMFEWEPVGTIGKVPAAYSGVAQKMGFLTLDGGELIVLDGQHRVVALRNIITAKNKPEGDYVGEVPSDEVPVIFIEHHSDERTRRIFNKVNRYAKATSRADNIITSEDDGYAIITRRLLRKGAPLGVEYNDPKGDGLIVDWKNNTITGRSQKLTTVSVVYESTKDILAHEGVKDFDEKHRVRRPEPDELDDAYGLTAGWWEDILHEVEPYRELLQEIAAGKAPSTVGRREDENPYSLLFKPAGQVAMVKGVIKALERGRGKGFTRRQALERVNRIDWRTTSPIWHGTIVTPEGRISVRKESYDLAAELIAYLIGAEFMEKEDIRALKRSYNERRGYNYEEPEEGTVPVELPEPVTAARE